MKEGVAGGSRGDGVLTRSMLGSGVYWRLQMGLVGNGVHMMKKRWRSSFKLILDPLGEKRGKRGKKSGV